MPSPTNENKSSATPTAAAENQNNFLGGTAQLHAPEFNIQSGEDRELSDEERDLGEKYLDDILGEDGSTDEIDDLFGKGFSSRFSITASYFEAAWKDLDGYDLGSNDKSMALYDHNTGADIMDALIGCISNALYGPEEEIEAEVAEGKILLEELDISTDLLEAYVDLFAAIEGKKIVPLILLFLEGSKMYDFVQYKNQIDELEEQTKKLRKLVDDAYKALAAAGIETAIDLAAIGLEASILGAIGVANPLVGGIIMMALVYGSKEIANGIIQPPEQQESTGTYLITKADESLDLMSKAHESSGKASEWFLEASEKSGKFKAGLTGLAGGLKTGAAAIKVKELEDFYAEFEKNQLVKIDALTKDFEEKIKVTGAQSKAIYELGLELDPIISNSLADIDYFGNLLDNYRENLE